MVRNCTIGNNAGTGIAASGSAGPTAVVRVTRSTITANGTGLRPLAAGSLTSYGDNNLDGNTTNGSPSSTIGYD